MTETFLGILELTDRGTAFVRRRESGYSPADGDLFVPPHLVKQYGLRTGDAPKPMQLFDLQTDFREQHDVSAKNPEIVARLKQAFDTFNADAK